MDCPSIRGNLADTTLNPRNYRDEVVTTDLLSDNPALGQPANPRHFRAITHLAIITTFLLPVTLLPYIVARRQLSLLRKQVGEIEHRVRILQQDLRNVSSEVVIRRDEHRRLRALIHDMMQETDELRLRAQETEEDRLRLNNVVASDLKRLLYDAQQSRAQGATLHVLGRSLADVAAFMHEVELEMGMLPGGQSKDPQRIDRLRMLALEIGKFDKPMESDSE